MSKKVSTLNINGELFPYVAPQYGSAHPRIAGKHFLVVMTVDVPETRVAKMKAQGVIDIQDLAEERVLEKYPHYQELTSYGTRKKGYWKHVKAEKDVVLFWVMNNQPASITFIVNKIDGLPNKDGISEPRSLYGRVQTNMQNGVTTQIVIPETGYSCVVEPVANKKQMLIFTQDFLCEKYLTFIKAVEDPNAQVQLTDEYKDIYAEYEKDPAGIKAALTDKVFKLQDYRQTLQEAIWGRINLTLREDFIEEWKIENTYTLDTRVGFAVHAQAQDILDKYARDFRIPAEYALNIINLYNKDTYEKMISTIVAYGPAFGISVKTTEGESDTMTYMPKEWMKKNPLNPIIPESVILKQAQRLQQSLRKAPINELVQAYIQVDWYLSQENPEDFYAPDWVTCSCGMPVLKPANDVYATHYVIEYQESQLEQIFVVEKDEPVKYDPRYDEAIPAVVCRYCDKVHILD